MKIPFSPPDIGEEEISEVADTLRSGWITTGPKTKKFEKVISAYAPEASEYWCNHGNWQGKLEYAPREQYGEGYWTTFEGLRVRVPERYDEYLTQKYGDWRADLPLEQQEGHHYAAVIDLHSPFCDYIVKLGKGRIRLKSSEELKQDGIALQENYQF